VVSVRESTGELYVSRGGVFDKENATSRAGWVMVRATDPSGLFVRANVSIDVRDANDPPVIVSNASFEFEEHHPTDGSAVFTVLATDEDSDGLVYFIDDWERSPVLFNATAGIPMPPM